jgi:hypothetical protein
MREAVFFGAAAAFLAVLVLGGVGLVRMGNAHSQQTEEAFKLACESTGGKPVWNFRYWECLK